MTVRPLIVSAFTPLNAPTSLAGPKTPKTKAALVWAGAFVGQVVASAIEGSSFAHCLHASYSTSFCVWARPMENTSANRYRQDPAGRWKPRHAKLQLPLPGGQGRA